MSFSGQSFPNLQYGNRFRNTKIDINWPVSITGNDAFEYRVTRFGFPRLAWMVPARNLTWQDKETLLAFWNQMGGSLQSFLYTDPEHNTLSNTVIGAGTQINPPSAPTLSVTSGSLTAGSYTFAVTAYNTLGETIASTTASITLSATGGVSISWGSVPGATGYRVYGRSGTLGLLIDVGSSLSYTDNGSITPGAASPTVNGTGTLTYVMLIPLAGVNHPLFHLGSLSVTPSNFTFGIVNGMPTLTYPAGSAPAYNSNVVANGSYQLCARFDSSAGYALSNAVNPQSSAVAMDAIKLQEVFE